MSDHSTTPPPVESGARIARFALSNAIPLNILFIVLVIVGTFVIARMPVDVWPDISLDEAMVETFWLGASAEDVERLITDPIEVKIRDIRGVDRIISDSRPDASLINVKFRENLSDTELDASFRQLRAAVEQVVDLPEDAEKPVVTKLSVGEVFFLLWVAIEDLDGVGEETLHDIALRLKATLREIPGVSKVDDRLIRDREVHIEASRDALRKHELTLQDLGQVLQQYNRNLPSGTLEEPRGELSIRAEGSVSTPEQLGEIVVLKNPLGGHVHLRDVARIRTSFARKTFFARNNLNDCLALGITKTQEADTRKVAERIHEALEEFTEILPPGVGLQVVDDSSHIITLRLRVLTNNLASGVVLVFLVLWVAVGLRNSILAILGIPFSFCCALISMHVLGVTINAISLIGLVLCAGMIVDDAIVVLENIYRVIEERRVGQKEPLQLREAIVQGTGEVLWPVLSSSATTVASFLPLLIMVGVLGEFVAVIPKTVTVVLLASLFECLLILPVHYLDFGSRGRKAHATGAPRTVRSAGTALLDSGRMLYDRVLKTALQHRYVAPLPLLGLAFVAYIAWPLIDIELFPSELQRCLVDIQVADEASLDQTSDIVRPLEALVLSLDDTVSAVLTSFGTMVTEDNTLKQRNNLAQMHVDLASSSALGADSTDVAALLRERIGGYVESHPDCGVRSFRVWAPRSGPPIGKPVSVRIESPDLAKAAVLAERYKARLAGTAGVRGIKDDLEFGRQQLNLVLREDLASVHGLTFLTLASVLRTANDGLVVSSFKDGRTGEDLDVRLMLEAQDRQDLADLLDVDIRTAPGYVVQIGQIADLEVTQGYAAIPHYNGKRVISVTAELDVAQASSVDVNNDLRQHFDKELAGLSNVRVTYGGQFSETASSFNSLRDAYIVALTAIYFLLATQFRSYVQPLIIISTVPFAWIGVIGGLLLSDYPFTTMTFIAIVGMSGVVVNDSILLVDCANRMLRQRQTDTIDAVRMACAQRLRPVLLTTMTTVLGLAPLALGIGGSSRIWSPFASSFAWGLTFSTLVTLIVVPVVYCIVLDATALLRRRGGDSQSTDTRVEPTLSQDRLPGTR